MSFSRFFFITRELTTHSINSSLQTIRALISFLQLTDSMFALFFCICYKMYRCLTNAVLQEKWRKTSSQLKVGKLVKLFYYSPYKARIRHWAQGSRPHSLKDLVLGNWFQCNELVYTVKPGHYCTMVGRREGLSATALNVTSSHYVTSWSSFAAAVSLEAPQQSGKRKENY